MAGQSAVSGNASLIAIFLVIYRSNVETELHCTDMFILSGMHLKVFKTNLNAV